MLTVSKADLIFDLLGLLFEFLARPVIKGFAYWLGPSFREQWDWMNWLVFLAVFGFVVFLATQVVDRLAKRRSK